MAGKKPGLATLRDSTEGECTAWKKGVKGTPWRLD